jgi:glutamine phosphoribosylpyrophosphate amidotransferase
MCGIFSGVGTLSSNRMIALGSMNEERGVDSVGIAYVMDNEVRIAKIAERPCVGLNITLRKEVTEAAVSGMFIGHTRQATQGTVSSRNAHPFLMDGIAFAHNGIIINDDDFGNYEVDSESLIHGIKDKDFSKYEGPIALVWIEDSELKAYRCGNPLFRGRHNGSIYLASDGDHLKAIGCTQVKALSEGMIYTFTNELAITTETVKKNKPFEALYTGKYDPLAYKATPYPMAEWADNDKALLGVPDVKEDFRTPGDIAKDIRALEHCECCGDFAELSDGGMCLACITFMENQGVNRDNPPSWVKAY